MENPLHKAFASHCGPVLLGKKPAALFTLKMGAAEARGVMELARESGLRALRARERQGRTLFMVYNEVLLEVALGHPLAKQWLHRLGYPVGCGCRPMLGQLVRRLRAENHFSHEVGFFLGYPPADVVGFICHGGKGCKHSGLWKVYDDVEAAQRLCHEYDECRRLCCRHVEMGGQLRALPKLLNLAG